MKNNKTTIDIEKNKKIDELIEKINILETKKLEKIKKYEVDTKNNKYYNIVVDYLKTINGYELQPIKNEFLKQYIKYNNKNVCFILFNKNNNITVYTKYKIENVDNIESTRYSCFSFKTKLSLTDDNIKLLFTIIDNSKNYTSNRNSYSLTSLKNELLELKQQ